MSHGDPEFGVNGAQVRIFLGELRALDLDRAIEVWNAYAVALERGYADAFEQAEVLASKQRTNEWLLARQSAASIARERLGDPAVVGDVVEVLASVAGSIVIRDLLSRHDFRLLQLPWTWDDEYPAEPATFTADPAVLAAEPAPSFAAEPAEPAAFAEPTPLAAEPAAFPAEAATAAPRRRLAIAAGLAAVPASRLPWQLGGSAMVPATVGVVAVGALAAAVALFAGPTSNVAVLTPTDSPRPIVQSSTLVAPSPLDSAIESLSPSPGESGGPTPGQSVPPGSTAVPPPPPTSGPGQTRAPTPRPTQPPPPPPTPIPTPTSPTMCVVVDFVTTGVNTVKAQAQWAKAGFISTVTFSPDIPPQYRIAWQSLTAGSSVLCSSAITVSDKAP